MKSIVIYYFFSGNTKKVAEAFAGHLRQKGEVDLIELKARDESRNFFVQCKRAFGKVRAEIEEVNYNLAGYDLICLGTPVWAFGPTPAVNTYLDNCRGVEGKEAVLFSTYGSGTGNEKCLNYMQEILSKKGARQFRRLSVQQIKIKNKEFVLSKIKEAIK